MARLITLDVTGTCIRVIGSPGFQYARIAREFDMEVDAQQLNMAFKKAFKSHNEAHPCYGCQEGLTSRDWWQMVIYNSFSGVGVTDKDLCNKIGRRVYDDFAGPGNWELFPEVIPALEKIKAAGAVLGVISNFDERLSSILSGLGIASYFDFVLASYEVKYAKPDPRIFQLALEKAVVKAGEAVHIGDNYELDYLGATQAGMKALLLLRDHEHKQVFPDDTKTITGLDIISNH